MNIRPLKVTVREVVTGYVDDSDREEGIYGYGGLLNIRPKYQRNYIYDDAKRNAVIDTVSKDFPLGIMYWVKNEDGTFEILDGQQRTISLCTFVSIDDPARGYSISGLFGNPHARTFSQLLPSEKSRILDYELLVYVCEGADTDRLRWFETINIAGERLSGQEIRNAQYSGPWVTDAKRYFSRTNSPAQRLAATKPQIYLTLPAANNGTVRAGWRRRSAGSSATSATRRSWRRLWRRTRKIRTPRPYGGTSRMSLPGRNGFSPRIARGWKRWNGASSTTSTMRGGSTSKRSSGAWRNFTRTTR